MNPPALHTAILRALSRGRVLDIAALFSIVDQILGPTHADVPRLDRARLFAWLCDHPDLVDLTDAGWILRAGVAAAAPPAEQRGKRPRGRAGPENPLLDALRVLGESTVDRIAAHLHRPPHVIKNRLSECRDYIARRRAGPKGGNGRPLTLYRLKAAG